MSGRGERAKAAVLRLGGSEAEAVHARFGVGGFSRHYHDTFSFGLVDAGANMFGYRRRTFVAEAGSIGICDPGEVHDGGMAGIPWAYRSIFPPAEMMVEVASELGLDGMPVFAMGCIDDPVSVRRLRVLLDKLFGEAPPAAVEEAAVDALATIIANNADGLRSRTVRPPEADVARRALERIHDGWDEPLSLSDIAAAAGVSRFAAIRSVARRTGLTPHAYLVQLRVARAKALIRGGVPIAVAAAEAGFADQSHLSRALAQRWGVPPGAFQHAYRRSGRHAPR